MCWRRNSSTWRPASSSDVVDAATATVSPLELCMRWTTSAMAAIFSAGWNTTTSGPSATISRLSSVRRTAISTITSVDGSSPVISRSIQASMGRS